MVARPCQRGRRREGQAFAAPLFAGRGRWRKLGLACLLAGLLTGCDPPAVEETPFLVVAGPRDIKSFEVRDGDDEVLWAIGSAAGAELVALDYGVVPAGFQQTAPDGGASPRPLRYGEPLIAHTVTGKRTITHYGFAEGPSEWSIVTWETEVIGRVDEVDAEATTTP